MPSSGARERLYGTVEDADDTSIRHSIRHSSRSDSLEDLIDSWRKDAERA